MERELQIQSQNYEIVPQNVEPISKSGIQRLLEEIRPVWKGKNLIHRVQKLLPVDPSSACQRLFNAAIHDLKEKIIVMGIDLAKEIAALYRLPIPNSDEDILDYNVSKSIDLSYRIGLLNRAEWRRLHRCYEIRRDLEHEDNEYEAVLEDCFYIFKSAIDIVLSKDPIELLRVKDIRDVIEISSSISISGELLENYKKAPQLRQKEITELLVSYAYNDSKPDIVRQNCIEMMQHIKSLTPNTVTIEIASIIESKLNGKSIYLKTAKISNACGAISYFKKIRLRDFYGNMLSELDSAEGNWSNQTAVVDKLEDIGGLKNCPIDLYPQYIKRLTQFYIGEPSFGHWKNYRNVFFSNGAAPIIERILKEDYDRMVIYLDGLRKDKQISALIDNKFVLRRFENLIDLLNKAD